jgi:hypothetical protein
MVSGTTEEEIGKFRGFLEKGYTIQEATAGVRGTEGGAELYMDFLRKIPWVTDPSMMPLMAKNISQSVQKLEEARERGAEADIEGYQKALAEDPTVTSLESYVARQQGRAERGEGPAATAYGPSGWTAEKGADPKKVQELAEKQAEAGATTAEATATLAREGTGNTLSVKFPDGWLSSKYQDAIEDAVLAAARKALFEYYLYQDIDPQDLINTMKKKGVTPEQMASAASYYAGKGKLLDEAWQVGAVAEEGPAPANRQIGGPTRPGLTLLHGGEFVVPRTGAPAGGGGAAGGQRVVVEFRGDAGRLLQVATVNTMYEARRRERTT